MGGQMKSVTGGHLLELSPVNEQFNKTYFTYIPSDS